MKLEEKFFKSFFFTFLSGVILSTIIVTIFLGLFTNDNYDKRTNQNIINIRKKYSESIIKSINLLLQTKFLKIQSGMNELILYYQKIANELIKSNKNYPLNNKFLKCLLEIDDDCETIPEGKEHMAFWVLDPVTTEENLDEKKDVKQELIAFSNTIQNLISFIDANRPDTDYFFLYFNITELFISFPLDISCEYGDIPYYKDYLYEERITTCIDNNGKYYITYKVKCAEYYINMMKSKTDSFDNNYLSNQNKTIYVTNAYGYYDYEGNDEDVERDFVMCIDFEDPITKGNAMACVESCFDDMNDSLESFNSKIDGYFFITIVGFNPVFYFPKGTITPKTATENIFKWTQKYKLEEKDYFHKNIRKIMSSNYRDYLSDSLYQEIYVKGNNSNSTEQIFYVNEEKLKYSIYPITLENLKGEKEHVMSIIYIYNEKFFLENIQQYTSSIIIKIILELLIFIIFGYGLLYIVYLTFNTITKYIVIPIKNVNYMLKGINIGGKYRLKYLDFLIKKRDENLEKLEKVLFVKNGINNEENKLIDEMDNDSENFYENNFSKNLFNDKNNIKTNNSINENNNDFQNDFNKQYDEESNYIDKECCFYDFDEQLLKYRSLEVENLAKSLMDLKSAINLTSTDRNLNEIIDYSKSENIFNKFKNSEGAIICQSNIGNLQSQLLKFDKAIYHLALSLQDNKLQKFISKNLSDELDEKDSLLKRISNVFNKNKNQIKNNILSEKQMNNSKKGFSQKIIGIMINTRYCRLIYAYYMFFKNMQKLKKLNNNNNIMNGQFMNSSYHTINYYHKIIIQYIYLSYVKNDLVKIGESILDYIEFLLKFKFKISSDNNDFIKIKYRAKIEYQEKQEYKKKIFNKIMNWFNLFDDYISYVNDYSSLSDTKCIIDDYSHSLNNENFVYNLESQTAFMFRINIQKSNFLKGKFCLYCKNYIDSLFYFIGAAKKESIVIDGLIKKKSLKHINKILNKINNYYEYYGLKNLNMDKELKLKEHEMKKNKINNNNKLKLKIKHKSSRLLKVKDIDINTFGKKIDIIKNDIKQDIEEYNIKKEKDLIILIDFNIYHKKEGKSNTKIIKIDAFIEQTIVILNNYLSNNDRLCVIIYEDNYNIICPLLCVNQIDNESFSKDLYYFKNKTCKKSNEIEEYGINLIELKNNDFDFRLNENHHDDDSYENSSEISDNENEEKKIEKINGLIKTLNYIINYLYMKESIKNEKYIILFTDLLNIKSIEEEKIEKILEGLISDKEAILLLVGKNKEIINIKNEKDNFIENEQIIEEIILSKFGEKSEIINFENMKKIKTILSNNKVIKDEIIFPNEIYK